MKFSRLFLHIAKWQCCHLRFQHGNVATANQILPTSDQSLPPNLVLFGISKEKIAEEEDCHVMEPPSGDTPIIRHCLNKIPKNRIPINVWVHSLSTIEPKFEKAAQLHPQVFGAHPRMDLLHEVVKWQKTYREVDYTWSRTRADTGRGKRKPWPQKGTGLVRQGSRNAPSWHRGGICNGPRGPRSLYYKPSHHVLVHGLTSALSVKSIQDDLVIVDDLEMPTSEADYFGELIDKRNLSENTLLFVHNEKNCPEYLSKIIETSRTSTLIPSTALNVWSILKHDKLVLPVDLLDDLESKLIWQMNRYEWLGQPHNFYKDMPGSNSLKAEIQERAQKL